MTMGPEPMIRTLLMSLRFGMGTLLEWRHIFSGRNALFLCAEYRKSLPGCQSLSHENFLRCYL
jgi:hypothetical protein